MDDSCEICGRPGADIVCNGCGRTVCDRCYNESLDICQQCAPKEQLTINSKGLSTVSLRTFAVLLISLGIAITSIAQYVGVDEAGLNVTLPTIFENGELAAIAYFTMTLLMFFICSSFLPWYIISRKGRSSDDYAAARRKGHFGHREKETLEYIITTELPRELAKSVYIEADEDEVYLMSTKDLGFFRSYSMPHGFEVGGIDYDYEGNYLIMKLILKRNN